MSASFVVVAFIAALLIVYWRLTLLVLVACLLALAVFGMGIVTQEQAPAAATPGSSAPPHN